MKKFFSEFKAFVLQGNVMNLAIGVIIGAAFQGMVTSLTDNILSPIIGIFAKQNFDLLQLEIMGTTIKYGAFITSVINFIIMAFIVFLLVKGLNRLTKNDKKQEDTKECPYCLSVIPLRASKCPACTADLA